MSKQAAYLIKGGDPILIGDAVTKLLDELVGDGDRSLLVDEFDLDRQKLAAAVDAAQTPPFLTDFRVVVVRRFGRFSKKDDVASVVAYLEDPLPSTHLVLAWEKAAISSAVDEGEPIAQSPRLPAELSKAVTAAGGVIIDTAPGKDVGGFLVEHLRDAGIDVDARGRKRIVDTVGEDAGAIVGIIERLVGTFGPGAKLTDADVAPLVGQAGGVPPWDLTDAIDQGDVPLALDRLQRMMGAGDRHALAVMASLQSHFLRMARLDGANVRGEKEAAQLLGMKGSTYPAKKAMAQGRKLGGTKVRRAVSLLAQADVDLRGAQAWPDELVMEVLVARLTMLSR